MSVHSPSPKAQLDDALPAEHGNLRSAASGSGSGDHAPASKRSAPELDEGTASRERELADLESELLATVRARGDADGRKSAIVAAYLATTSSLEPDARKFALERTQTLLQVKADIPSACASIELAHPEGASLELERAVIDPELSAEVGQLVERTRRVINHDWMSSDENSSENLRRMFAAMASDIRVILISLAHRVGIMHGLRALPERQRPGIARETMGIFAPLANRIGVWQLKWQLEDLSLRELEPDTYKRLSRLLDDTRRQRNQHVQSVLELLEAELERAHIPADVKGRPKHIHSIYGKMKRKQVDFDEIYDVTAVRVIVEEIGQCYAVLGLVHGMWAPIPGEFDDYIAQPKGNMYQSLHTAVVGPDGKPLEVQIRTHAMHEFAEFGVAAHWAYKEGGRGSRSDRVAERQFDIMHQLMDWQTRIGDDDALDASLQREIFREQVYVFTPRGEVIDLPRGATALDFAYRIHTMVGHRCRGVRIDGKIRPLHTKLQTGQRVEVLTRKTAAPSRDWLNPHSGFIRTNSARAKIKHWFRQQGRANALEQGRILLAGQFEKFDLSAPGDLDAVKEDSPTASPTLEKLAERFDFKTGADLLVAIGFGDMSAHRVAASVARVVEPPKPFVSRSGKARGGQERKTQAKGVSVSGTSDIMSQPATCCRPVPGDPVLGFISKGRGVVIHRRDCPNLAQYERERLLDVDWGVDSREKYPTRLEIHVRDGRGVLRQITEVIALQNTSIVDLHTRYGTDRQLVLDCTVEISTQEQLLRIMSRLERLDCVDSVVRRGA